MRFGRLGRMWIAWIAGFVVMVVGLFACSATDEFTALQIVQVQNLSSSDCIVPGSMTAETHKSGKFDVYLPDNIFRPYKLALLVTNNLDSVGGSKATEMNNIFLTHFSVQLSAPGVTWTSSCPANFDTDQFTYELTPAGGSFGTWINILAPYHAQCLLDYLGTLGGGTTPDVTVTVTILAKGHHGGTDIQSAPFVYSIDVCAGCLQTGYSDPALVTYNYPNYAPCAALAGSNPYPGDPCLSPGEDEKILCCVLPDKTVICPAVPTGSTSTITSTSTTTATGP